MKSNPLSASSVLLSAATLGLLGAALGFNWLHDANANSTTEPVCVDPCTPNTVAARPNGTASQNGVSLNAALSQAKLQRGADGELYLHCGVSVSEDAGLDGPRRPLNLALVLDTSGSMQSSMPLLRQATLGAIERLGEADKLTIVTYSSSARLVYSGFPARDGKDAMTRLVNNLQAGGNTNISAGIELAANQLNLAMLGSTSPVPGCKVPDGPVCREPLQEGCQEPMPMRCQPEPQVNYVKRMLVLTDGLANLGVTEPNGLRSIVTRVRSGGSAVSSLGLGAQFNEELLGGMADSGGGAYHYVSEPAALDAVYAAEVEAMQGLVAKQAELVITAQDGTVLDTVFYWPTQDNVDARTVSLGDLSRGRSLKVMARVKVGTAIAASSVSTLQVSLRYQDPDTGEQQTLAPIALSVGVSDDASEVEASVDEAISGDLAKVRVARQLEQARDAAKQGNYAEAEKLARECKEIVGDSSLSYDAPAGAPCEVDFDELADGLAEGGSSERGRRALKESHAAQMGAAR